MERAKNQMSGFGCDHCYFHGRPVPNFAHQDDFGSLAQGRAKAFSEVWEILAELTMGDRGAGVRMHKLDRVFERKDMNISCLVQLVNHSRQCGGLAAAGGAGDENDTVFFLYNFTKNRRQSYRVECRHI